MVEKMIKSQFSFPECYIRKQAYCDDCKIPLQDTGTRISSLPQLIVMRCPKCKETYNISENELQGQWKWRTI